MSEADTLKEKSSSPCEADPKGLFTEARGREILIESQAPERGKHPGGSSAVGVLYSAPSSAALGSFAAALSLSMNASLSPSLSAHSFALSGPKRWLQLLAKRWLQLLAKLTRLVYSYRC